MATKEAPKRVRTTATVATTKTTDPRKTSGNAANQNKTTTTTRRGSAFKKQLDASLTSRNIEMLSHFSTEETNRIKALFHQNATYMVIDGNGRKANVLKRETFNRLLLLLSRSKWCTTSRSDNARRLLRRVRDGCSSLPHHHGRCKAPCLR